MPLGTGLMFNWTEKFYAYPKEVESRFILSNNDIGRDSNSYADLASASLHPGSHFRIMFSSFVLTTRQWMF